MKKRIKSIFKIIIFTCIIFVFIAMGSIFAYYKTMYKSKDKHKLEYNDLTEEEKRIVDKQKEVGKKNHTIAIFGVDHSERLTDVIMVLNYNKKNNDINVIRVPRDTYVEWTDRQKQLMENNMNRSISHSKINALYSLCGKDYLYQSTINELENKLGVEIDNYVLFNLKAFRYIVDSIGGVEVNVPQNMKKTADHIDIDLKSGVQVLDGHHAEMLIRYRDYKMGDLQRIEMQNLFMKEFFRKLTSKSLIQQAPKLIKASSEYVDTDIGISEMVSYIPLLSKINAETLKFNTMPGTLGRKHGRSYYVTDYKELDKLVNTVFYKEDDKNAVMVDRSVSIEILNGAGIPKAAGNAKKSLEKVGYEVDRIGNYNKNNLENTIIIAKDEKKAKQFMEYYPNAQIQNQSDINYDIQIVLGKDIQ